jgi:hypothetical protein
MDISSVAVLAGNTLVAASVTDAWETARSKFSHLFGHGRPDPTTERRFDATRDRLILVPAEQAGQARAELAERWAARLADLLEDDPVAEDRLRALVSEVQALLPAGSGSATDHSLAVSGNVTIQANRGSVAAGVIHGNVMPPGPTGPDPVPG